MIDIQLLNSLKQVSSVFLRRKDANPIKILSLGYPSVCLPTQYSNQENFKPREPNNSIERNLKTNSQIKGFNLEFFEFDHILSSLFIDKKFTLEVLDIHSAQYPGIIWDLNKEIPYSYYNNYDLILDSGSLEHCFNIGTAFQNIARMLSLNGMIVSAIPYFSPHHGYYNVNPNLLYEFYCPLNGFKLVDIYCKSSESFYQSLSGTAEDLFTQKSLSVNINNWRLLPKHSINTIYYISKKINDVLPEFTMQAKYR